MSTLKIQERFTLPSPKALVWEHLTDPTKTVACLPGAEITGQDDERTYSGTVKVKVGAVAISYRGQVVFEEIDEEAGYVRIVGKGREKTGSGSAEMTMEGRVGMAPGSAFGPGNEGYLRLCFAGDTARLAEAMNRFEGFLHARR